jgi:hypothetical protein
MPNGVVSELDDLKQNDVEKSPCLELSQILKEVNQEAGAMQCWTST